MVEKMSKEDIEIYKMLKSKLNKLGMMFAIGVLLVIFGIPLAFVINVWFGIASIFLIGGYFVYYSSKWKEFEETAITLGYDVSVWGDLRRIK